jgi:predicted DNA-binding protein (MmcQ/YjbR family)
MDIDWVRHYCLLLRGTTEQVQWQDQLVFKVGGKMFAVVPLEPGERWLSFKCTREEFVDLVERPGIVPARYLARAHWVSLETEGALRPAEIERLLRQARDLVFARLPKRVQTKLLRKSPRKTRSRAREA